MARNWTRRTLWKERWRKVRLFLTRLRVVLLCVLFWAVAAGYGAGCLLLQGQPPLSISAPNVPAQIGTLFSPQAQASAQTLFAGLLAPGAEGGMATELGKDTKLFSDVSLVLQNRLRIWQALLTAGMALSLLTALGAHLLWRARFGNVVCLSRTVERAKNSYLNTMALLAALNLLLATLLYRLGYAGETGVTFAQLAYNGVFLLCPLAAAACTRLAAPLALSGRGCYFRRL